MNGARTVQVTHNTATHTHVCKGVSCCCFYWPHTRTASARWWFMPPRFPTACHLPDDEQEEVYVWAIVDISCLREVSAERCCWHTDMSRFSYTKSRTKNLAHLSSGVHHTTVPYCTVFAHGDPNTHDDGSEEEGARAKEQKSNPLFDSCKKHFIDFDRLFQNKTNALLPK